MIRCVAVESPVERGSWREDDNSAYLERCVTDCVRRGESSFSIARIYPGTIGPEILQLGYALAMRLDGWAFYLDRGVSHTMIAALRFALWIREDLPTKRARVEFRSFGALGMPEIPLERWREIRRWDADPSAHADVSAVVPIARACEAFSELGVVVRRAYPELLP